VTTAMPEEQWSESEKWVWGEIQAGWTADFNKRDKPVSSASRDIEVSPAGVSHRTPGAS
jgi:hypothetical protein